ncbi:hypothetical protein RND81_14G094500 [Saponaria officinalis]|uniref:F-box domain-containing protein n=1 Tax=Saponaria officinalis TaxID=3572 RepID=A0AAW1GS24_SAPOF
MAAINYDLNDSLHFPPLSKCYAKPQRNKRTRKRKEDDNIGARSRIDDLNDTLLELIFKRLSPWKYLAKSKCVSKRWNSIISNPDFTRHLTHESFPFTLFLKWGDRYKCLISEHPYFQKHKLRLDFIPTSDIVVHTNELFVAYHDTSLQKQYYIANPLTKQYVIVPIPLTEHIDLYRNYCVVGIA